MYVNINIFKPLTYKPSIGKLNILETCIFFFFHLNKLSHNNAWPGTACKYIKTLLNSNKILSQNFKPISGIKLEIIG